LLALLGCINGSKTILYPTPSLKEGERLFVLGLDFDLDFDLNPLYVAPSIAGFEGIARRGAARKPHVDRQHTEVLSANPLETETNWQDSQFAQPKAAFRRSPWMG
jgi:hypothetical protein